MNIKQRISLWAAIAFYIVAAIFGSQYLVSHDPGGRGIAILALASAILAHVGVWTLGLDRHPADSDSDYSDEHEWQDAIK